MNNEIINTVFLLFMSNFVKGDVQELQLNKLAYLPPLENSLNNGYLPPQYNNQEHIRNIHQPTQTNKENLNYKHNKPAVIDDPMPMRVDYVQPLGLDFVSVKYKPFYKGALISGLFFNENVAQILNRETASETRLANDIGENEKSLFLNAKNSKPFTPQPKLEYALNYLSYNDSKKESLLQAKKYVKTPVENVVPINYYVEKIFKYKLFNYDDDTELTSVEPVVIFKPGDDISFTEDTTVIDNYEHKFHVENLNKLQKFPPLIYNTTTTTTTTPNPLITHYTQASEAAKHQLASEEKSQSNHSEQGYIYEKPKIPFMF